MEREIAQLADDMWSDYWRELGLVKRAVGQINKTRHLTRAADFKAFHDRLRKILQHGKVDVLCTGTNV